MKIKSPFRQFGIFGVYGKFWNLYWKIKDAYLRAKQGYTWSDVWNINDWFIDHMIPMLEHLLKHGSHSCPTGEDGEPMENWDDILNEMLEGFKCWKVAEEGILLPESEWKEVGGITLDCRYDMNDEERAKYEHALQLFAKWHCAMWD